MLTEDDVVAAAAHHLADEGWRVVSTATTSQTGDDVRAERDGKVLLVEAKGATSAKPHTKRYGKPFSKNQVHDHVAKAVLRAMRYRSQGTLAAIALPDNAEHRAEVAKVQTAIAHLHIAVLWVADTGEVSVDGVLGTPAQTTELSSGDPYLHWGVGMRPVQASDLVNLVKPTRTVDIDPPAFRYPIQMWPRIAFGLPRIAKWHAHCRGQKLRVHRSWTGFAVCELHFELADNEHLRIDRMRVNNDPRQYERSSDDDERHQAHWFLLYHFGGAELAEQVPAAMDAMLGRASYS